jgi:hypothetical protein
MHDSNRQPNPEPLRKAADCGRPAASSQSIDWYADGEERVVEVGLVRVTIRLVGRNGRRARISITASNGAAFSSADKNERR